MGIGRSDEGSSVMDGTIRIRTAAVFATSIVIAVLCTLLVTQAWSAGAAPGDSDATFVPISPCRVVDQRQTTPMTSGGIVTQQITGTNGDCTIPSDAIAVAMNVTITRPSAQSFLTVFPADLESPPNVSNLNWLATSSAIPNKVDVKLSPAGAVKFYNDNGTVVVIGDIVGYYTNATLQELSQRVVALETAQAAGADSALLARLDALETSMATKANTADVNAALATKLNGGPVTTSMGPGAWTTTDLSVLTQDSSGALASGDGFAYLALTGPETRGGVEYTLKDVTYCIKSVSDGGGVQFVGVTGYDGTSGNFTGQSFLRNTPGCYTLTPFSGTRAGKAFMLSLEIAGGGAARVTLSNVTANWDTRAALGAAS
jgi:hypothetical protein